MVIRMLGVISIQLLRSWGFQKYIICRHHIQQKAIIREVGWQQSVSSQQLSLSPWAESLSILWVTGSWSWCTLTRIRVSLHWECMGCKSWWGLVTEGSWEFDIWHETNWVFFLVATSTTKGDIGTGSGRPIRKNWQRLTAIQLFYIPAFFIPFRIQTSN